EVQQMTAERAPTRGDRRDACPTLWHPDLAATRVVHTVWNPAKHRIVAERPIRQHFRSAVAVVTAALDFNDQRRRRPFALLWRDREDLAVRAGTKPVRVSETGGKRFGAATIG